MDDANSGIGTVFASHIEVDYSLVRFYFRGLEWLPKTVYNNPPNS